MSGPEYKKATEETDIVSLAQRVKALAIANDMDYVGIAPVDRWQNAPSGYKPNDLLPGAQSVISMGIKISLGPQLTQKRSLMNKNLRHIGFSYRWLSYGLLNMHFLDRAAFIVSRLLESEGHLAVPIVASGVENLTKLFAAFSNRHAAVAAGLGVLGWNGICLTPDNGPRQRFVSVITDAPLDCDPLYQGRKICDVHRCRKLGQGRPLCVKACPISAFSTEESVVATIGGRDFEYAWMDHAVCGMLASASHELMFGREGMEIPSQFDYDTALQFKAKLPLKYELERMTYRRGHSCSLCMMVCPVGAPKAIDDIIRRELEG